MVSDVTIIIQCTMTLTLCINVARCRDEPTSCVLTHPVMSILLHCLMLTARLFPLLAGQVPRLPRWHPFPQDPHTHPPHRPLQVIRILYYHEMLDNATIFVLIYEDFLKTYLLSYTLYHIAEFTVSIIYSTYNKLHISLSVFIYMLILTNRCKRSNVFICSLLIYKQHSSQLITKGGQTAILVRWSAGPLPSGLPKC
jgi:hypothetical protein